MFCSLFSFFFRFLLNVSGLIQIHSNTSKKKTCLILNVCKCQMVYVCMYVCMHVCVLFSKHTHSHTYYTECNFLTAAIQFGQLQ